MTAIPSRYSYGEREREKRERERGGRGREREDDVVRITNICVVGLSKDSLEFQPSRDG